MTRAIRLGSSIFPLLVLVVFTAAMGVSCAATPSEPTAVPIIASVPTPSPTPTPTPKCICTSVTYQFDPGGATPVWNAYVVKNNGNASWRIGFRIDVKCQGTGQSNLCVVHQNENGALTFTVDGKTHQIVGRSRRVTFPKAKVGDPWEKEYSDALGADYPTTTTGKMSATLDMEFELVCLGPDKVPLKRMFRIQGSFEAQAPGKGMKPVLTNTVINFTPIF